MPRQETMLEREGVVIVADRLAPPYDEGMKNIAVNFILEAAELCPVTLITDNGSGIINRTLFQKLGKFFLHPSFAKALRMLRPRVIFYIPSTSLTFMSFLRMAVIKLLSPRSKTFLVGLQARGLSCWTRALLRVTPPDGLVVLSQAMRREFAAVSEAITVFTPGVDVVKFEPLEAREKAALRKKYGINRDDFVVLHVGHLKKSRRLETVVEAQRAIASSLVVVASSTFQHQEDQEVFRFLEASGARVLTGAIDAIQEVYQFADCYVFPVIERTGATEMPLSVLEAMAANLVIVTTPYGALPEAFPENPAAGLFYATDVESFAAALNTASKLSHSDTRAMVTAYSWRGRVAGLLQTLKVTER